jgi:hypothetical protein
MDHDVISIQSNLLTTWDVSRFLPAYTMLISGTGKVKDWLQTSERGCCHASAERHLIRSGGPPNASVCPRFCALRHIQASPLIVGGVHIVTIRKRLSHAKPSITLAICAHMFHTDDSEAAAAINAAFG